MDRSTKFLGLLIVLSAFLVLSHPGDVRAADTRSVWLYKGGYFKMLEDKKWSETNPDGAWMFQEKARTADYVELYDETRDYTVRLYATEMYLKGGNDKTAYKFKDFTKLYGGEWRR
jgi:hypothetical protein